MTKEAIMVSNVALRLCVVGLFLVVANILSQETTEGRSLHSCLTMVERAGGCAFEAAQLKTEVEQLATGNEVARIALLKESRNAPQRRKQIIKALMTAMDQPNLNFAARA